MKKCSVCNLECKTLNGKCPTCLREYTRQYLAKKRALKVVDKPVVTSKVCSSCKIDKPLDCFTKNVTYKYGCLAKCRECHNKYQKERRDNGLEKKRYTIKEKLIENKNKHPFIRVRIEYENSSINLDGKVYLLNNLSLEEVYELRRNGYSFIFEK